MLKYIPVILLAIIAVVLTYLSKKIAPFIFKKEKAEEEDIFKLKITALIIGVFDFVLVMLLF